MNKRQDVERIRRALDASLSGLQDDPWLAQRVVAAAKGEKKVKKKISVGLAVALVLAILAATALAVGMTRYFSSFAALENTYGEYEQWPGSAKVELVQTMRESELLSQAQAKGWDKAQSEREKEKLAEQILGDYFERLVNVDTYNVMLQQLGQFEDWPQEEKALYSSLLIEYGVQKDDWPVYLMPEQGDMQQDEAIQAAREILCEKFMANERIKAANARATFLQNAMEYGEAPVWIVELTEPNLFSGAYRVILERSGEVRSYDAPGTLPYTAGKEEDIPADAEIVQPGEYDLSYEEIERIAWDSIREIGDFETRMQRMTLDAVFLYDERYNDGCEPVWLVSFKENGAQVYRMLFGYDGAYIDGAFEGCEFERTARDDWEIDAKFDLDFAYYTVEEKAAFTQKWKPLVDAYCQSHPYYPNYNSFWYKATRQVYGVPGDGDISQEEATRIAKEALMEEGLREETMDDRRIAYTFDVTDPEQPIWKLMLYPVPFEARDDASPVSDHYSYQVIIDGETGSVLHIYCNSDMSPDRKITIFNM